MPIETRMGRLHPSKEIQEKLMELGFTSAQQIAEIEENYFIKCYGPRLGLEQQELAAIHKRAVHITDKVMHSVMNVRSMAADPDRRLSGADTIGTGTVRHFQELPGYQELFGELNDYDYDDGQTIFSLAAYFTDLMRITDRYVIQPNDEKMEEQRKLSYRRPDLWELPLNKEGMEHLIPYIRIVKERLACLLKKLTGKKEEELWTYLEEHSHFPHPEDTTFALILWLLKKSGTSGRKLSDLLGDQSASCFQMGITKACAAMLSSPQTDEKKLCEAYGLSSSQTLESLSSIRTFLDTVGMTGDACEVFFGGCLSKRETEAGFAGKFYINQGRMPEDYLSLDTEEDFMAGSIQNLDGAGCDRIHRFLSLQKVTGFEPEELDWLLTIVDKDGKPDINEEALKRISKGLGLMEDYGLTRAELAAVLGDLKTYGGKQEAGSPFDQIFNPASGNLIYHPHYDGNILYGDAVKSWRILEPSGENHELGLYLSAGTGLPVRDLQLLAAYLQEGEVGTKSDTVSLTVEFMSALYRHSILCGRTGLSMEEYLLLLEYTGEKNQLLSADGVRTLLETAAQVKETGTGLKGWALLLEAGLTAPDRNQVKVWLTGIQKAGVEDDQKEEYILEETTTLLGGSRETTGILAFMFAGDAELPKGMDKWYEPFYVDLPECLSFCCDYIAFLSKWGTLIQWCGLSCWMVETIASYPGSYGLDGPYGEFNLKFILTVWQLKAFTEELGEDDKLLTALTMMARAEPDAYTGLEKATGWNARETAILLEGMGAEAMPEALQILYLKICFAMLKNLGCQASFLMKLLAAPGASRAEKEILIRQLSSCLKTTLTSEEYKETQEEMEKTRYRKERDALLPEAVYQLREIYEDICSSEEVYQYLLIDVSMDETASISYIKEGANAVQTYLTRCRMNLEKEVAYVDIPDIWWQWIMDYTMWEGNRQVFVYPENYLLPSVRKTKSQLFKDMESGLLQSEITPEYMDTLYHAYMDGFEQLSRLVVTDSMRCHVRNSEEGDFSRLYLFGRTRQQPYKYYYCMQEEGRPWTEWSVIDVNMKTEYVTPVFAFQRLFLFWLEPKKISNTDIQPENGGAQSRNRDTYNLSIYYTFLNLQGEWVSPQILVSDEMIWYEDFEKKEPKEPVKGLFHREELPWMKLYALPVSSENFLEADYPGRGFERLILAYGKPAHNTGQKVDLHYVREEGTDKDKFERKMGEYLSNYNRMIQSDRMGYLFMGKCMVLNSNMEQDFLMYREEYLLLDGYWKTSNVVPFRFSLNSTQTEIGFLYSKDVLADNYMSGMQKKQIWQVEEKQVAACDFTTEYISDKTAGQIYDGLEKFQIVDKTGFVDIEKMTDIDLGQVTAELMDARDSSFHPSQLMEVENICLGKAGGVSAFTGVEEEMVQIKPVLNQPGWYLLSTQSETLLLRIKDHIFVKGQEPRPPFSMISDGLRVSRPPINEASIKRLGGPVGKWITNLKNSRILDEEGYVLSQGITEEELKACLDQSGEPKSPYTFEQRVKALYRLLRGYSVVRPEELETESITAQLAVTLYGILQKAEIVDVLGRLDGNCLMDQDSGKLFLDKDNKPLIHGDQITRLYHTLLHLPCDISIAYHNLTQSRILVELFEYQFEVIRLSAGAVPGMKRRLLMGGVDSLLSPDTQLIPVKPVLPFERLKPNFELIEGPAMSDGTGADFDGLYGNYYWEVFYHLPMLAAQSLRSHGQFEEAVRWMEYVFNPRQQERFVVPETFYTESAQLIALAQSEKICEDLKKMDLGGTEKTMILSKEGRVAAGFTEATDISALIEKEKLDQEQLIMVKNILMNYKLAAPGCCHWNFLPFRKHVLEDIMDSLSDGSQAMKLYNQDPFNPHAIARLRIDAYEKYSVIQYVRNLIDWGDRMFAMDTWESISKSTLLYNLAGGLLGKRPRKKKIKAANDVLTFQRIREKYKKEIPQFLLSLEDELPDEAVTAVGWYDPLFLQESSLYFKIPENRELLRLWDILDDRLQKIRHSMNLYGEKRQLPLNAPLLSADALLQGIKGGGQGGFDNASVPLSRFRFKLLLDHAKLYITEMTVIEQQLLSSMEKKDNEKILVLQQEYNQNLMTMVTETKKLRIDELEENVKALDTSIAGMTLRSEHYKNLISNGRSSEEEESLSKEKTARNCNIAGSALTTAASLAFAIPQVGSPFAMTYGGQQIGMVLFASAAATQIGAVVSSYDAQRSQTMAGYKRREEEWKLQQDIADNELLMAREQRQALEVQKDIARQELQIHLQTVSQDDRILKILKTKFSNEELYDWMIQKASYLYWQLYQIGLKMTRLVQKAYQFELDTNENMIPSDLWDNQKKGLMSAAGLSLVLSRLEYSYYSRPRRELEIEKVISLANQFPAALEQLKKKGWCEFELTESMFESDYKGHYRRKIKSISLSVPLILGPYETLKATLTQTKNCILMQPDEAAKALLLEGNTPPGSSVRCDWSSRQKIAISRGNDSRGFSSFGFESEAYSPFEGTGAVSAWKLDIPKETNSFDWESLSNVIITMDYTAVEG